MQAANRKREIHALSGTLLLQATAAGLLFGFHVVSARLLSIEDYGALSFGLTLGGLLALVCALGYPNLVLRQVATALQEKDWPLLKGVGVEASRQVAALSLLVAAILTILVFLLPDVEAGRSTGLLVAAVAVCFYPLGLVRAKFARGLGTITCSIVPEQIFRPAAFMSLLWLCVGILGVTVAGLGVVMLLLASLVLTMMAGLYCVGRNVPFRWSHTRPHFRLTEWRGSSRRMLLGSVLQEILLRSDVIVLGLVATMEATAQFSACAKLALLNTFVLKVIDSYYAPKMAEAFHAGSPLELRRLLRTSATLSLIGSVPIAMVLFSIPGSVLALFGSEYQQPRFHCRYWPSGPLWPGQLDRSGTHC